MRASPDVIEVMDGLLDPYVLLQVVRDGSGSIVDFRYTAANLAACAYNGVPREQLVGRRLLDLLPGHVAAGLFGRYVRVVETGEPLVLDGHAYATELRDGSVRRYDVRAVRVGDGISYTWRDVTDQFAERLARLAAEQRYQMIAENASDVAFSETTDGTLTWLSPSVTELLGREPDELVGRPFRELVHPEDLAVVMKAQTELRAGRAQRLEVRLQARDGGHHWVDVLVRPTFDATGAVTGRTGGWRDITAYRVASQSLAASEARFSRAFEAVHHTVAIMQPVRDADGALVDHVFLWVNRAGRAELGWRDVDLTGRRMSEVAPLVLTQLPEHDRVLRTGQSVSVEVKRDERWFAADYLPFGEDLLIVTREMTPIKRAELRIRELNASLERRVAERTAELETFNQSLSHDLRGPLRWINSFAGLVERREADRLDPQSLHYLQEIRAASERMARLFEALLDYSRLGRHAVRTGPVAWEPVVGSMQARFETRLATGGSTMEVHEPLAPVRGDPLLVERILGVLIENGLTYVEDPARAHVTLSAERLGDLVRISVTDAGIGIAAEHQERVFEAFSRLHDVDQYPGSGIGLAAARRSARMMGSEVHVTSQLGVGSTFWFDLPAQ